MYNWQYVYIYEDGRRCTSKEYLFLKRIHLGNHLGFLHFYINNLYLAYIECLLCAR